MSPRGRALALAVGGLVQVGVGAVLLGLLPQATDESAIAWWLRLGAGLIVLAGVALTAAALRWWSRPGPQRGLPALAMALGVAGVLVSLLGGILFVVDGGPDGGTAFVLGVMLTIPQALAIMLAAIIRRESAVAAGPPTR